MAPFFSAGNIRTASLAGGPTRQVAYLHSVTELPVCVGFGIANPAEAGALAPYVDGVVIGSAFERTIEENLNGSDLLQRLEEQVRNYKAAMRISPPQD